MPTQTQEKGKEENNQLWYKCKNNFEKFDKNVERRSEDFQFGTYYSIDGAGNLVTNSQKTLLSGFKFNIAFKKLY